MAIEVDPDEHLGLMGSHSMNCSCFKEKYLLVQALRKSDQKYCVISNKGKGDREEAWNII